MRAVDESCGCVCQQVQGGGEVPIYATHPRMKAEPSKLGKSPSEIAEEAREIAARSRRGCVAIATEPHASAQEETLAVTRLAAEAWASTAERNEAAALALTVPTQLSAPPAAERVVRVARPTSAAAPFCNRKKFEKQQRALGGATTFLTSAGPFVPPDERLRLEQNAARKLNIHEKEMDLNAHSYLKRVAESVDRQNANFAMAGYRLPADQPKTAFRNSNFYNVAMHKYRHAEPKQNLYM